jgi:outer membrane protein assembly factor BamE (lipoprotein component of BamABCDE complex)
MSRFAALAASLLLAACAVSLQPRGPYRSDELFGRIQAGMSKEQVFGLTGPPDNRMGFSASRPDSWGYFYWDTWGYYAEFSVTFDENGRVVSKISRRLSDGRSRD